MSERIWTLDAKPSRRPASDRRMRKLAWNLLRQLKRRGVERVRRLPMLHYAGLRCVHVGEVRVCEQYRIFHDDWLLRADILEE